MNYKKVIKKLGIRTETTVGTPVALSVFKSKKKKRDELVIDNRMPNPNCRSAVDFLMDKTTRVLKKEKMLCEANSKLLTWQDETFTIRLENKLYGKEIYVRLSAKEVLPFVKPLLKAQDLVSRDLEKQKILKKIL